MLAVGRQKVRVGETGNSLLEELSEADRSEVQLDGVNVPEHLSDEVTFSISRVERLILLLCEFPKPIPK